jgi:hypothetical protein
MSEFEKGQSCELRFTKKASGSSAPPDASKGCICMDILSPPTTSVNRTPSLIVEAWPGGLDDPLRPGQAEREAALLRRWPHLGRVGPQPCNQHVGQTLLDHLAQQFGVYPLTGPSPQEAA